MTKEHLWAKWLKPYLPREGSSHTHGVGRLRYGQKRTYEYKSGPGDIQSKRLKIVCRACNNGWMSRLQEQTKPILLPLIEGKSDGADLSDTTRRLLSAWVMMFTMVVEFADPATAAISDEERKSFSYTQTATDNWMIWMGRAEPTVWKFFHFGWLAQWEVPADPVTAKPNSQVTTFRVGDLIFHAYSTSFPNLKIDSTLFAMLHRLVPLWPAPLPRFGGIRHILDPRSAVRLIRHIVDSISPGYVIDPSQRLSHPDAPLTPKHSRASKA